MPYKLQHNVSRLVIAKNMSAYEAAKRFSDYRRLAAQDAFSALKSGGNPVPDGIVASDITGDALAQARQWHPSRRTPLFKNWNWDTIYRQVRSSYDRFELALWHRQPEGDVLCVLAVGRTSSHRHAVRLDYLEAYPFQANPIKPRAFQIVDAVLVTYGTIIGARVVEIPQAYVELVAHYAGAGYAPVQTRSATGQFIKLWKSLEE